MLQIRALDAGYGNVRVLEQIDLNVSAGEILCVMGRNGAGKTTLMKAIMGLVRGNAGEIILNGTPIQDIRAHEIPKLGIGYIPQGRRLFSELTVEENIRVGLMTRKKGRDTREKVLEMFPRLRERLKQRAHTLSGGEQQMLATARALCLEPSVLLLDEPTEGLQPSMTELIRNTIVELRSQGVAIILVEQRVDAVRAVADRVSFIESGMNAATLTMEELEEDPAPFREFVGV